MALFSDEQEQYHRLFEVGQIFSAKETVIDSKTKRQEVVRRLIVIHNIMKNNAGKICFFSVRVIEEKNQICSIIRYDGNLSKFNDLRPVCEDGTFLDAFKKDYHKPYSS